VDGIVLVWIKPFENGNVKGKFHCMVCRKTFELSGNVYFDEIDNNKNVFGGK
jgi:hypothetical protein